LPRNQWWCSTFDSFLGYEKRRVREKGAREEWGRKGVRPLITIRVERGWGYEAQTYKSRDLP
jgi:hypothetical protein